jgi:ATP-dependent RNA helicase DDX51/DBP6
MRFLNHPILLMLDSSQQVLSVVKSLAAGADLKVKLCVGAVSYGAEKAALMLGGDGVSPAIDILVASPGRLAEHMLHTKGFSLSSLEYLVIDEADRILNQTYQDWLPLLLRLSSAPCNGQLLPPCEVGGKGGVRWAGARLEGGGGMRIKKLLFSATLKGDARHLGDVQLRDPLFLTAGGGEGLKMPEELREYMAVCSSDDKLVVLVHALLKMQGRVTVVFSSTVDGAHRVARFLQLYGTFAVAEYSSALTQEQRTGIIEGLRQGGVSVLVCSDAFARGMDFADVQAVINYDAPLNAMTYVHRSGRTARAGREGTCISIVTHDELARFKNMLRGADNNFVRQWYTGSDDKERLQQRCTDCMRALQAVIEKEKRKILSPQQPLSMLQSTGAEEGGIVPALKADDPTWQLVSVHWCC